MLSQALYWLNPERQGQNRAKEDRWFRKSREEWEAELGLISVGAADSPKTTETHEVLARKGEAAGAQDLLQYRLWRTSKGLGAGGSQCIQNRNDR